MSLQAWINSQLKNKGLTVKQAKKNAGKYKSIAAAKKAGSLYYTNKDGKIMIAPDLPDNHNGTFTYFVLNKETQSVENMFYNHTEAIMYNQKVNGNILITPNIY